MDKPRKYATAVAFRSALEDRLKSIAVKEGIALERARREVSFDRLLARLFARLDAPWVLKGGYALELRMKEARATRDIDLALRHTLGKLRGAELNNSILDALQKAAKLDLEDFFVFQIGDVMRDLDAAPYGGARFPVTATMAARTFVKFHIDVGAGDVVLTPLDSTQGRDWLGFAGIAAPAFPTVSREQHFAEKIHAYTVPRQTPNSRARDLVDLVLLIDSQELDPAQAGRALQATFKRRKTHELPPSLEPPPPAWKESFAALTRECGLSEDLGDAFAKVSSYFSALPKA
ncbi:MAG: nucleotidyl transferase AbiEii/AbiGii toxin family protein [Elusimicrobia bacterium]|nr:nucleotidyl transferase AbiEii/AbiGii toxin family protein [Elusimicrobiota bacterium]